MASRARRTTTTSCSTWPQPCKVCGQIVLNKAGYTKHFAKHVREQERQQLAEEVTGVGSRENEEDEVDYDSPASDIGLNMSEISSDDDDDIGAPLQVPTYERPKLPKIIPDFELRSEIFYRYEGPVARLAALDIETLRAGYLVAKIGLSRAEMDIVNDYVDFQRENRGSAAADEAPAALPSKKVIDRKIMKACDREPDGMIKRAVFQVPADVPGCETTELEFMVYMPNLCLIYA